MAEREDKGSCYAPVSSSDQPIRRGNSAESAAGCCSRPNAGGGGRGGGGVCSGLQQHQHH